jgi:serine/threonine protein kinase
MIHRDVKPGNFIHCPDRNEFFLVDFGSSVAVSDPKPTQFTKYFASSRVRAALRPSTFDDWCSLIFSMYFLSGHEIDQDDPDKTLKEITSSSPDWLEMNVILKEKAQYCLKVIDGVESVFTAKEEVFWKVTLMASLTEH